MDCKQYSYNLELVRSLDDPDPDLAETIKHIRECPNCTEKFTESQKFDELISEKFHDVEVPPYLASRIKANLAPSRPVSVPFNWSMAWVLSVLVFVSSIVSSVIYFNQLKIMARLDTLPSAQTVQPVAKTSPAPQIKNNEEVEAKAVTVSAPVVIEPQEELESSHNAILELIAVTAIKRHKNILGSKFVVFDNNEVNDEFKKRFKFPISLPKFSENLKLVGGSKCHSCTYEMAYLLYRQGPDGVSLCIFPASDFGLEKWSGLPETIRKNGHNVAVWKKRDNVYVMVFKNPVSEVESMVCDLRRKN